MNLFEILNRMSMARALLLGLAFAAFYYFLFFDNGATQRASIAAANQQIGDLQKQLSDTQAKLDRAAVFKKTAAEVGATINRLLAVIPEHFNMNDLMKLVSNEVKVAGSSLINITPGTPEISHVAKEFEELSVSIDLNGSFLQHMVLLSNLTKMTQILIVRKFEFNQIKEAKGDEAPTIHMTGEIVAYRYRGSAALATPANGANPGGTGP